MHRSLRRLVPLALLGSAGCGSSTTLDLGHGAPPWYATRETIAAEDNAPPGVPTVIAGHQFYAYAIAVDDTRVYWTTMDAAKAPRVCAVHSCAKSDCARTLITYTSAGSTLCHIPPAQLLVNRTHVFWLSVDDDRRNERIYACPIEGCPQTGPMSLVQGAGLGFAVDETHLYWQSDDATIWRCPPEKCVEQATLIALRDSRFTIGSEENLLIVDATQIYWLELDDTSTVIKALAKDGPGTAQKLANVPTSRLALDESNIYWMQRSTETEMVVKSCPLIGCSMEPRIVASKSSPPRASQWDGMPSFGELAVDGDQLFWTATVTGGRLSPKLTDSVHICSTKGCGANSTALVERQTHIERLAIDASHVYWTSYTSFETRDGLVQRIRRRR